VLICAHLDTVFPADVPLVLERDGDRIAIPGASDNGAGLAAMLALAAALKQHEIAPACDVVFAGTVGEEGDGNLRGMRAIFASKLAASIGAVLVLDGAGSTSAVSEALGSRRFEVEITGPGGHSWSDSERPNPIVALASAIAAFQNEALPETPATSVNFATIQGGTSVNSIPQTVLARVDIRSVSQEEIVRQEVRLHRAVEDAVLAARQPGRHRLRHTIRITGHRPAGKLAERSFLAESVRAVDRHLQLRTRWRIASTDANIPLSLGVPAVSVGGGGTGGGAHTLEEWYDPAGRDLALRRILLLALVAAEHLAFEAAE
jgi:acetylornithine deacetylase/succinyl-diaminopimelate desuccinylase-like protein